MEAAGGEGDRQPSAGSVQASCPPLTYAPSPLSVPRPDTQADFEGLQSSVAKMGTTRDPYPATLPLPMAGRKARRMKPAGVLQVQGEQESPWHPQMKKKCGQRIS